MAALVDTSVFVALEKVEATSAWCRQTLAQYEALFVNPIIVSELLLGVEIAPNVPTALSRHAVFERATRLRCLDMTTNTAKIHARLCAALLRQGASRWRQNDLWLAASAIEHDAVLVTCNARDFADIVGLKFERP